MKKVFAVTVMVIIVLVVIALSSGGGDGNKYRVQCYQNGVIIFDRVVMQESSRTIPRSTNWIDVATGSVVFFPNTGCVWTGEK